MKRAIIVHGTEGSPGENWFPWLSSELRLCGISVVCPQFPTPENQSFESWLQVFTTEFGDPGANDLLIGHSTGVIFLLNVLNRISNRVAGTFLVSGFQRQIGIEKYDALNASFFDADLDWRRIRANAGQAVVYHSDNDPYVPLLLGEELAGELDAPLRIISGAGHINAESGYLSIAPLLSDLSMIRRH